MTRQSGEGQSLHTKKGWWHGRQASFNPPAITLSIPKEGAPEGLTLLNSKFVVNVLGQGKEKGLVKLLNQVRYHQPIYSGSVKASFS